MRLRVKGCINELNINVVKIFDLVGLIEVEQVAIKMGEHVLLEQLLIAV